MRKNGWTQKVKSIRFSSYILFGAWATSPHLTAHGIMHIRRAPPTLTLGIEHNP